MSIRPIAGVCVLSGLIAGLLWLRTTSASGQITNPQPAPAADDLQSVTLIFGHKDPAPAAWDGSISISAGKIERLEGYHFTQQCRIEGNSWKCATHPWGTFSGGMHPNEKPQPQPTPLEPVGVTVLFRAPSDALLSVKVPKGEFSFRPIDIPETEGIFPLQATVEIYRTPVVQAISDNSFEDDYPSLAVEGQRMFVSWLGYRDTADRVFLRIRDQGTWGNRIEVSEKPGDLFGTAVVALPGGKAMVIWSAYEGDNWRLKARTWDGKALGSIETITSGDGKNLFHRAAADSKGNVHLAYQSWRRARSDIYLRSYTNGSWGKEISLSDPQRSVRANDWSPSIAVGRDGMVWVAWDSYALGSYNINLRSVRNGVPGPLLAATSSARFHAHPSLAIDAQNRVWLAYDEGPENWGKDVGFLLTGGSGLYQARTIKVAVYDGSRWLAPLRQPEEVVPYGYRRFFHTPRLAADSEGRMWLVARPRTSSRLPTSLWAAGGKWELVATYYSGDRWSELFLIPESVGRNEGELQLAADRSGSVHFAHVSDRRLWGGPNFGEFPQNNDIMVARLRSSSPVVELQLAARQPEAPAGLPAEPRESEQIARLRGHTLTNGGSTYRIFRGDLHRHTDISMDGAGDGSLWDAYRYAMDAAGMDYFVVTDHQSGQQEYTWWRIDKSADMFHVPGFFTALYGTERSLPYPNGHRNLVFAKRGIPILPITDEERKSSTGPVLYPYLRQNKGIATSHTSHTNMGTDWRDNDPDLEPIVEIFQGARTSAEHEGAPLSPTERRTELHAGGYRPLGYVWNAWKKGYKLGVQASSDHVSTHTSYSCVLAENGSRDALMDAMRKRHTYAATTNVLLDYRLTVDGKSYVQGDIASGSSMPELIAKIVGTGPLKRVALVRNNEYIYTNDPSGDSFDLRYRENTLSPGEHYYYVRVEQKDGNVAWSSPIWLKR
jgi:hypothetical protein